MFKDKIVLITGGTGSWGHELVKQLLTKEPQEIRIFSRGEMKQVEMERKFNEPRLKFIIGDVRDQEAVMKATKGVHYVFHLAALKHVPICEEQPEEAIKTNILGTQNLIHACLYNQVEKVIDVSTDKAVDALNLYGMSKAIGERLMIQANQISKLTRFVCIRAGNVLGSNGSVVPFFIKQIEDQGEVTLTHPDMTRYFMTLPEAIGLLFKGVEVSFGGEVFVMRMPAYRIEDLARILIQDSGKEEAKVTVKNMRPGEKLHEVLVSEYEASHTFKYDANYYVIMPTLPIEGLVAYYKNKNLIPVHFVRYTSLDEVRTRDEGIELLRKGNFLKGYLKA